MGKAMDNVRNIYLEGIAGGNAREAVNRYTGHRYTQHSTGVADGACESACKIDPLGWVMIN